MSDFKKMVDSYKRVREIQASGTGTVHDLRSTIGEELTKVRHNQDLSDDGKRKQVEKIQKEYGAAFMKQVKQMKDEHDSAIVAARNSAQRLLNEGPKKPSADDIKSFERGFNSIKMQLMLETDAKKSMKALTDFIEKQNDPFMAQSVINDFPSLVNSVLDSSGNDKDNYKVQLKKVFDNVKNKATTEEQREAERIYDTLADDSSYKLFKEGLHTDVVTQVLGKQYSEYLNKPHLYVSDEGSDE